MGAFRFDGKTIPFEPGDTVGSALHRAGVRAISRSMKYHRPRGLYCMAGSCGSCFVDLDGIPNVPACTARAEDGSDVCSQNTLGSARRDLLGVIDKVYPVGFDPHDAFTKVRPVNAVFLKAVRSMSGWGSAPGPDEAPPRPGVRRQVHVDEVIVGSGLHGLRRAATCERAGRTTLLVEEAPELGGSACFDPSETEARGLVQDAATWKHVETWTQALAFGIYDKTLAVWKGTDLIEVTADRFTFAPGQHDGHPLFEGNDLPGVLSLRGAMRLWYAHGVLPGKRIVAHGTLPARFAQDLESAGARIVAQGDVSAAMGNGQVKRVTVDTRTVSADAVVCQVPGTARIELVQQAGCALGWADGTVPVVDADGRTSRDDVHALFTPPSVVEVAP